MVASGWTSKQGPFTTAPCLLVQPDATIYVDPGLSARVDDLGNIIIEEQG